MPRKISNAGRRALIGGHSGGGTAIGPWGEGRNKGNVLNQKVDELLGVRSRNAGETVGQGDQKHPGKGGAFGKGGNDNLAEESGDLISEIGGNLGGGRNKSKEIGVERGDGMGREGVGPEGGMEGGGKGSEKVEDNSVGAAIGGRRAQGKEAGESEEGIQLGT